MTVLLALNAYRRETTTAGPLTSNGSRTPRFPAEPSRAILALLGESNNFERWRLVFPFTIFSGILGTKFGENEKSFKRTVSHPASLAVATKAWQARMP